MALNRRNYCVWSITNNGLPPNPGESAILNLSALPTFKVEHTLHLLNYFCVGVR